MPREKTAIVPITNQALDDPRFQQWMVDTELTIRKPQREIEDFDAQLEELGLKGKKNAIIEAHRPFGMLTTYRRVATQVWGFADKSELHAARVEFNRTLIHLKQLIPDSPILEGLVHTGPSPLRGIGAQTTLTPTELAISYMIYRGRGLTISRVAREIDPVSGDIETAKRIVIVNLSRIRGKLPQGLTLPKSRHGNNDYLAWETSSR